jgi:hypothetical protein
MRQELKPG